MSTKQRRLIVVAMSFTIMFGIVPNVGAMHIMEGYLQAKYCIVWGVLCIPFLVAGFFSIKKITFEHRRALLILAMAGAFAFVLSSLKIPSVTGSSSHPTGTGLGDILFGPSVMSIIGIIVLLFQAMLLAHGGLTTLGANTFSMAIAGPFLTYGIYKLGMKFKLPKFFTVLLASALGNLFTYCITSFQLAIAYPSEVGGVMASMGKFLTIFALTQIPLAIIEGILTALVIGILEKYAAPELSEIGYLKGGITNEN